MGPGFNLPKVTPPGDHKVSVERLTAWADKVLETKGYVASCGHHWDWGSATGLFAWVTSRKLRWTDRPGGNCQVPLPQGGECGCCADHLVHRPLPEWAKGTPREVVRRILRESSLNEDDPREVLGQYWKLYSESEWKLGKRAWKILALRGLDDPDLNAIASYYREDHGEGALLVPSEMARREAERLRRGNGR